MEVKNQALNKLTRFLSFSSMATVTLDLETATQQDTILGKLASDLWPPTSVLKDTAKQSSTLRLGATPIFKRQS